jgi:hypothetical protein
MMVSKKLGLQQMNAWTLFVSKDGEWLVVSNNDKLATLYSSFKD